MKKKMLIGGLAIPGLLAIVIYFVIAGSQLLAPLAQCTPPVATRVQTGALPGEQRWNGTSSLLFGANDASWDWSSRNMGNNPAIRTTVKRAGITVIRTTLTARDALQRVAAIEQTGALCLGILQPQDAAQVVQMLGQRCNLYEWGNEPDNQGISVQSYSQSWNQAIPHLRRINPHAAFIGPVVSYANIPFIRTFLQLSQRAHALPDVVSYHMYPCSDLLPNACLPHLAIYEQSAQQVAEVIQKSIGHALPQAVTEWNYSWKPGQTPNKSSFMQSFSRDSLQDMARADISIANQFDLASNAGYGSLDMIDPATGKPYAQFMAIQQTIASYQAQAGIDPGKIKRSCR